MPNLKSAVADALGTVFAGVAGNATTANWEKAFETFCKKSVNADFANAVMGDSRITQFVDRMREYTNKIDPLKSKAAQKLFEDRVEVVDDALTNFLSHTLVVNTIYRKCKENVVLPWIKDISSGSKQVRILSTGDFLLYALTTANHSKENRDIIVDILNNLDKESTKTLLETSSFKKIAPRCMSEANMKVWKAKAGLEIK